MKKNKNMKTEQTNVIILSLALFLLFVLPSTAKAQTETGENDERAIHFSGDTVSRYDFYGADGNQAGQVFGAGGKQWYQDLAFTLSRQENPFNSWIFEFAGVANNSIYRSPGWGGETERIRFQQDNGSGSLPYRLEAGDIYGNFSYRTLQRSLRGIQIDLQPRSRGNSRHSILLLYGVSDFDWKLVERPDDRNAGLSWLWQKGDNTSLNFNYVFNRREANPLVGALERDQRVYGLAMERKTSSGRHPIVLEAEIARFSGDHEGLNGAASGQNRDDNAFFAQVSGGSQPFTYRLRHEIAGQDFRPVGGNVAPDRKSWETYASWDLKNGRYLNARWQSYRNNYETANPNDDRIFGLGLRGPIDRERQINGGIDAFIESIDDDQGLSDSRIKSIVGDISRTFSPKYSGRLALSYRETDDRIQNTRDNRITQLAAGLDHATEIFGWSSRVGLDLENRLIDSGGERSREFTPALAINMQGKDQDLGIHYRFQRQDRVSPIQLDIDTAQAGLRYQKRSGPHTLGIEYLQNRREDTNGIWSKSYQITGFWRYEFDEIWRTAARKPVKTEQTTATDASAASEKSPAKDEVITGFDLGKSFADAVARLESLTGSPAREWGNMIIGDLQIFKDIPQRQRIVLCRDGLQLEKTVLVIDVDGAIPGQVGDVLERARRTLIEKYGAPTEVYETGNYGPKLAEDLRAGLFARSAEWVMPDGTLRLGLPRRLDGRLRVEVQWSGNPGRLRDQLWGLNILE